MGFTSGLTGGVTLTLGIAYLTVLAHERNRISQAQALRSQSRVLTSLLEPTPIQPPQTRSELAREERSTIIEAAKDRWNNEIENAVRWVQRTNWDEVREGAESSIARLLGGGLEKSRDAAQRGADRVSGEAHRLGEDAKVAGDKIAAAVKEQASRARDKSVELKEAAKAKTDGVAASSKSGAQEAAGSIRRSGGTVDAARGAVREFISEGIEKGREALGKAQATIGTAGHKVTSSTAPSNVEKALEERYTKPDGLNKSVEETLEDRYKPIEARDNTVLRGV